MTLWTGKPLRRIRRRRKLTQTALAKKTGMVQATIARYEAGRQPPLDVIERLARALRVRVAKLLK